MKILKLTNLWEKMVLFLFDDNDTIMTHCNAGALATVAYGTALGVIRATRESGKNVKVIATETRPIQQGSD